MVFIFFFKKEAFDEEVFVVFLEAVVALLKMEVVAFVRAHRACLNMVTWCCCCCSRYDDGAKICLFLSTFPFISFLGFQKIFLQKILKNRRKTIRARAPDTTQKR